MYNNSKKLVIFGLVSILLIAGLYPVFSDTNQIEITKMNGKIQTVEAVANPSLIVTVSSTEVFELGQFTVHVQVQGDNGNIDAKGATVTCDGAILKTRSTDDFGYVTFTARCVEHDTDYPIGAIFCYNGDYISGSATIKIKDNYLSLSVSPTTVNEGNTFNVEITDHSGVHCTAIVVFNMEDHQIYFGRGSIVAPYLPRDKSSEKYDLYAYEAGYQNSNSVTITVKNINCPPNKPSKPSGPTSGAIGIDYTFSTSASDPDMDDVKYKFDWGDGTQSETVYYSSGAMESITHRWEEKRVLPFTITVTAIDNTSDALESEASQSSYIFIGNNPPIKPSLYGPENGYIDAPSGGAGSGEFKAVTSDPDGHQVKYDFDWGDTNSGWLGPYTSGTTITESHSFSAGKSYSVKVMAEDEYGAQSGWSNSITVIVGNLPPNKPSAPSNSGKGKVNEDLTFTTHDDDPNGYQSSVDGNADTIYYCFDWGDTTTSGWFGRDSLSGTGFLSGETASATHAYHTKGTYHIKVQAKDNHEALSVWSDETTVIITKSIDSSTSSVTNVQQNSNVLPIPQPDSNDLPISQSPTNTGTSSTGSCGITTFSASMKCTSSSATVGQTLTFTAQPLGGTIPYTYSWDLAYGKGHGDFSSSTSISRYFASSGIYTINVRVRDATGAIRTASQTVTIISSGSSSPSSSSSSTVSQPSTMTTKAVTNN